ncbi:hypothetical protein QBC47DRAFT_365808 [Echria macrotheca]|uniref:Uncharacterized protein n=1 Tax=Echria macrotheca TaxID=438768 RepID=A0AAJ0B151_9PEZI|nr:hypothetical protein QBC47DRAFT_365808 [Echria macrotheca]
MTDSVPPHTDAVDEAVDRRTVDQRIRDYGDYINELHTRHPETFSRLKNFIDRGHKCKCGSDRHECHNRQPEFRVRVYDIHRNETNFFKFLQTGSNGGKHPEYFDAADHDDFRRLKKKLFDDLGKDNRGNEHCRLITVNHLSPNVAKLLGGLYDIPGDFFNRHLPGTEAISGRLISMVTSALQIDFDELYEARDTFDDLWKGFDTLDGHDVIRECLQQNFLFYEHPGWDYFPVTSKEWKASRENILMTSGTESTMSSKQNVFQFDLTHRVSVYSQPPHFPRTAILIFYPRLPICSKSDHYRTNKDGRKSHFTASSTNEDCKQVYFRAVPDKVPGPKEVTNPSSPKSKAHNMTQEQIRTQLLPKDRPEYAVFPGRLNEGFKRDYASAFDREFQLHVQDLWEQLHPKKKPTNKDQPVNDGDADFNFVHLFGVPLFRLIASNWARLVERRSSDLDLLEWRPTDMTGIDTVQCIKSRRIAIARHQKDINTCLAMLRNLRQEERVRRYRDELRRYVHDGKLPQDLLQGAPDLGDDKAHLVHGSDLHEVKMETMRSRYQEDDTGYNKGLTNGLVGSEKDDSSWDAVYYDFFELKASIDALASRADKIQEGMLGLLSIRISESSSMLNSIGVFFSVIIIPWTVVGGLFSIDFDEYSFNRNGKQFGNNARPMISCRAKWLS